jgi:hypothetical protein
MAVAERIGDWEVISMVEEIRLVPYRSVRIRLIVLAVLVAFVLISLPEWRVLLTFVVGMTLLLGTFPRAWIRDGHFEREFRLAFFRVHRKAWRLDDVEQIEIGSEEPLGCVFAPVLVVVRLVDRVFPWVGGEYKIWLQTFGDRRASAWQGFGDTHFRANLEALETATGRTAVRGTDNDVVTTTQLLEMLEELPGGRWLGERVRKIPLPKRLAARMRRRDIPPRDIPPSDKAAPPTH